MWRRGSGQSIVEMAFVLPVLLILIFGVMEFGYIIYAYSTVSQAARNGAEAASQLPPYPSWLAYQGQSGLPADYPGFRGDACVRAVYVAAESDQTLFNDVTQFLTISYPDGDDTRNLEDRGPIQVTIAYPVTGITPLFNLVGLNNGFTLRVTQRRSLETLGRDPTKINGVACAADINEWKQLNPPE